MSTEKSHHQINSIRSKHPNSAVLYSFFSVLKGILKDKFFRHFRLLAYSAYTLLQEKITMHEMAHVEDNLKQFVEEYQVYYGETSMTMNVHCLSHLADCVKDLGPLWSQSMFNFESFNGTLKHFGARSNNVINQVIENIIIETTRDEQTEVKCSREFELGDKISVIPSAADNLALFKANIIGQISYYSSLKKGAMKLTSTKYNLAKKTMDYFVNATENVYGKIKYYVKSDCAIFCLIDEYSVYGRMDQFIIVRPKETIAAIPIKEIIDKFVYMKIGSEEFIVKRPNKIEVN